MVDCSSVIKQIKQSDIKICLLTKEITEMETEIKKLESKRDITRAENKQILQDIKYKKNIIDDKNNEISILQKELDVRTEMKKQKKIKVEEAKKELEEIQQKVLDSRIYFNERANQFLNESDYLLIRSNDIELAVHRRKEENKLLKEIDELESDIKTLEKEYTDLKNELKFMQNLEKTKQALEKEPETGEFKRIQLRIEAVEEEIEDLETNYNNSLSNEQVFLQRYSNRNDSESYDKYNECSEDNTETFGISDRSFNNQDIYLTETEDVEFVNIDNAGYTTNDPQPQFSRHVKRNNSRFTPKMPSYLANKNASNAMKFTIKKKPII